MERIRPFDLRSLNDPPATTDIILTDRCEPGLNFEKSLFSTIVIYRRGMRCTCENLVADVSFTTVQNHSTMASIRCRMNLNRLSLIKSLLVAA
jgi:hypothetical protein